MKDRKNFYKLVGGPLFKPKASVHMIKSHTFFVTLHCIPLSVYFSYQLTTILCTGGYHVVAIFWFSIGTHFRFPTHTKKSLESMFSVQTRLFETEKKV